MEYFFYCRDGADTGALREELTEQHWAFMDGYADGMIARGPTLTPDREAATGSLHIVDLPDAAAAQVFAYQEPNYRAGVYADVLVRRWRNELGRTMWEYDGDPVANLRFMVLAEGTDDSVEVSDDLNAAYRGFVADRRAELIAAGPLLAEDGTGWLGSCLLLELPGREAVDALLAEDPFARAGRYASVEVHDWQFGGRPAG